MKLSYKIGDLNWYDIIEPNSFEINEIVRQFSIDPGIAEEILIPVERPKVQVTPEYTYMVLHFPETTDIYSSNPHHENKDSSSKNYQEVDFLILKDTLITIHTKSIPLLYDFSKTIENPSLIRSFGKSPNAGMIFMVMMKFFYENLTVQMDSISRDLRRIEDDIFSKNEEKMVEVLSSVNRKILDLKRAIQFHGETLERYSIGASNLFGEEFKIRLETFLAEYRLLLKTLASLKEITDDLWKTNDTLLSTKVNDTMRKLTALSFVTFPLSVIVGMFGMNMDLPLVGGYRDFIVIILAMIALALMMLTYLQHKKWL